MTKTLMAGIDLHSNNLFCGVMDAEGKTVFERKLPCDLPEVLKALAPFKNRLETIAVESTYNWYWLVDGLQEAGYHTVLANPAGMVQYNGRPNGRPLSKTKACFLSGSSRFRLKFLRIH